jgi:Dickkopf-like protein
MRRCLVILLLALAACSSKPANQPPPETTLTAMTLCSELAKTDCDRIERCGMLVAPIDRARCLVRQEKVACLPYQIVLSRAVDGGEATFFENEAKMCKEKISTLDCGIGVEHDFFGLKECQGLAGGQVMAGGRCSLPASCSGNDLACLARTACPGTCKKLGANNDPCGFGEPCGSDFFCAATSMRCHARAPLHEPCEIALSGNACAEGGFCDASQPSGAVCNPVRGRGNGCRTPYECAAGLRCVNNLCSSGLERDSCNTDADCEAPLRCAAGRCATPAAEGGACSATVPCREGFVCVLGDTAMTGSCGKEAALGESCSDKQPCWLGRCTMGTCVEPLADGAACTKDDECLPSRTCSMGRCAIVEASCQPT